MLMHVRNHDESCLMMSDDEWPPAGAHLCIHTYVYIYIYVGGSSPTRPILGNLKADDHPTGHPHTIIHVCIGIIDGHGSLGSVSNHGCARLPWHRRVAPLPWHPRQARL